MNRSIPDKGTKPTKARRIVFVYSTRDYNWLRLPRNLSAEPVFLETVRRCDSQILTHLGWSIERDLIPENGMQMSEEQFIPGLTAMQIALTDLWTAYGVAPNAVVGSCTGEFAAGYAAGALSLENAMELACRIGLGFRIKGGAGRSVLVDLDLKQIEQWQDNAPQIYNIAGCFWGKTLLSCRKEDFQQLLEFLKRSGIGYRQILTRSAIHGPANMDLESQFSRPFLTSSTKPERRVPFYSAFTGNQVGNSLLNMHHWWQAVKHPLVQFDEVFHTLFQEGYDIFMEINTELMFSTAIQDMAAQRGAKIMMLPSLSPSRSPSEFIGQTLRALDLTADID